MAQSNQRKDEIYQPKVVAVQPHEHHACDADRIDGDTHREFELQLRRERHCILRIVDHVKVGNETEDTLLLFNVDLLDRDLLCRTIHRNRGLFTSNLESNVL